MKIVGTDISLDVCRAEGYLMMQYDGRKKFDKQEMYRVFRTLPDYIQEEIYGAKKMSEIPEQEKYATDTLISWEDTVEIYMRHKKEIDDFAETNKHVNFDNPDHQDLLWLADNVDAYCGLG